MFRNDEPQPWILSSATFLSNPDRLIIRFERGKGAFVSIVIQPDSKPGYVNGAANTITDLFREHDKRSPEDLSQSIWIEKLKTRCREKFPSGRPQLASQFYFENVNGFPDVIEATDQLLLPSLKSKNELACDSLAELPIVPRSSLRVVNDGNSFLLEQCRLVSMNSHIYVAKGPIWPERAKYDYDEIRHLCSLPECHPNIIRPPVALISLTEVDSRICGWLLPYHKKGNLDCYARELRSRNLLSARLLYKWALQIVRGLQFLLNIGTWHGDIKPDNVVISDDEDAILIDFTRSFCTFATASPEIRDYWEYTPGDCIGIPSHWSLDAIEQSEVYSIGRTLYLVGEGFDMGEIYKTVGWINADYDSKVNFGPHSQTPQHLQVIVLRCVDQQPSRRPSLSQLQDSLVQLQMGEE
ncbi:hypothetical protein MMC22_002134 [Lobaria immixta]|nr:hypothetical protein [Lobaria immixta]